MVRYYAIVKEGADIDLARETLSRNDVTISRSPKSGAPGALFGLEITSNADTVLATLLASGFFSEIVGGQDRALRLPPQ